MAHSSVVDLLIHQHESHSCNALATLNFDQHWHAAIGLDNCVTQSTLHAVAGHISAGCILGDVWCLLCILSCNQTGQTPSDSLQTLLKTLFEPWFTATITHTTELVMLLHMLNTSVLAWAQSAYNHDHPVMSSSSTPCVASPRPHSSVGCGCCIANVYCDIVQHPVPLSCCDACGPRQLGALTA